MKKIIAVILAMTIALSSSVFGFAASGEIDYENAIVLEPIVRVNPHYADVISAEDLKFEIDRDYVPKAVPESSYISNYEEAGEQMREHLVARDTYFEIYYKISDPSLSLQVICENIIANALAHTGEPTEGDYIQWHYGGWGAGASGYGKGDYIYYTLKFQFAYYTTAEQEAELTKEVNRVLDELDIEDKNDYLKIKAIYDYICDNITYDYYNLGNDSYDLKYTAYAALINKTAVCQGYASLFYRMALQMGVDARFISGDAGGPHGWNIVQMGDYYYNLDSTWDSGRYFYRYFLVCPENFMDHTRDEEYDTAQFHAAYPMGASDYVYNESDFGGGNDEIASGYCGGEGNGQNLEWKLDSEGVLTISGTGKMADYEHAADWYEYADKIKVLVLEEGMTSIGKLAFAGLTNVTGELIIPNTVITIGDHAFSGCSATGDLVIPDSVVTIDRYAFLKCKGFDGNLLLSKNLETVGEYAFNECVNLKGNLVIPDNVTDLQMYAFHECRGFNGKLIIGKGVESIPTKVFAETGFTGDLIIPDTVTEISSYAFENCKGFSGDLHIGNGVKYVGASAFAGCSGFRGKLVIGENVKSIRDNAFSGCSGFTGDLIIPESVTIIYFGAFENCEGFNGKLVIGKNVEEISGRAFYNCTGLSGNVVIPKSVKKMSTATFKLCGINEYYFEGNEPKIGGSTFDSDSDTIYYPKGMEWTIESGKWNGYNAVEYRIALDINGDASVDIKDVYYLRLVAAKLISVSAEDIEIADVDGDGKLSAIDANILRKYIAGIITELPVA